MKYLILFIYFICSLAISQEKLGTVEVIGISPLPGILIEKNSVNLKLTIGSEVQFQTDRTRAPILIKKYCFYKRYYICKILS